MKKRTKIIPFNWDTYEQDKEKYKVVTRDGESVSLLSKNIIQLDKLT
jgi:hypothetical protein